MQSIERFYFSSRKTFREQDILKRLRDLMVLFRNIAQKTITKSVTYTQKYRTITILAFSENIWGFYKRQHQTALQTTLASTFCALAEI